MGGREKEERRKGETWSKTEIVDRKRHHSAGRKRKDKNRGGEGGRWMERGGMGGRRGEAVASVMRKVKRRERKKKTETEKEISSKPLQGAYRCEVSYSPET